MAGKFVEQKIPTLHCFANVCLFKLANDLVISSDFVVSLRCGLWEAAVKEAPEQLSQSSFGPLLRRTAYADVLSHDMSACFPF